MPHRIRPALHQYPHGARLRQRLREIDLPLQVEGTLSGVGSAMDIIEVANEYYILAKSPLADDRTRVLKEGDTFAVFDRYGDIQPFGLGEQGIYHEGTRFLSRLVLEVADKRPLLL